MACHFWCNVVLLSVISWATLAADLNVAGHARKFFAPHNDDIDALVHLEKAREKAQFSEISSRIFEDAVNEALHNLTEQFDPIHIPFLPTINVNLPDNNVDMSLTLADIAINGLSSLDVKHITTGLDGLFPSKQPKINATLARLSLDANHYSAGGHVINIPFVGEGNLTVAFIKLDVCIGFELQSVLKPCAVLGSSFVILELGHMVVDFEGLVPGTDMGQTINTVLGSFGPDIIDAIEARLMSDPLHAAIDKILINAINAAIADKTVFNCPHEELWEN